MIEAIKKGQDSLENMRADLEEGISNRIPEVTSAINQAGQALRDASHTITQTFERMSDWTGNNSYQHFDTADRYIEEYSKYAYYGGLAVSSTLLLILLCIVFGLLCGICGKRPDGYGDDCCNKGAGSRFLMLYVILFFFICSFISTHTHTHMIIFTQVFFKRFFFFCSMFTVVLLSFS